MSLLYRDNQGNETHIAGLNGVSGELVPSVSLYQSGTDTTSSISAGGYTNKEIIFTTPMPDTDYVISFDANLTGGILFTVMSKTVSSFVVNIWNFNDQAITITFKWTAFKLMTDETTQLDEAQIQLNKQDITSIKAKIPDNASSSNKLVTAADNNFKYTNYGTDVSAADANTLTVPGVYSTCNNTPATQHLPVAQDTWVVLYVTRVDNNPNFIQQKCVDWNGNEWIRVMFSGSWGEWTREVLHKDIAVNPGTFSGWNIWDYTTFHINNVDWSFLKTNDYACGRFELAGVYWGMYNAFRYSDGCINIEATIDFANVGGYPEAHTVKAFYNATYVNPDTHVLSPYWVLNIDGKGLSYNQDGILITYDVSRVSNQTSIPSRVFVANTRAVTIGQVYTALSEAQLLNRPAQGYLVWTTSQQHTGTMAQASNPSSATALTVRAETNWMTNPRIGIKDPNTGSWVFSWNDGYTYSACDMNGELDSGGVPIISLEYVV